MDKVIRDGKVAVLVSSGYGAGWYSWNSSHPECLFHPEIVKVVEEDKIDQCSEEFFEDLFGEDFYAGGRDGLYIEWVDEGSLFKISEYDGYERIEFHDNIDEWTIA